MMEIGQQKRFFIFEMARLQKIEIFASMYGLPADKPRQVSRSYFNKTSAFITTTNIYYCRLFDTFFLNWAQRSYLQPVWAFLYYIGRCAKLTVHFHYSRFE